MNTVTTKQNIRIIWVFLVISIFAYHLYNPQIFHRENIAKFIEQYHHSGLCVLLLLHIFRGFTMIPATLLIFAGVLIFPNDLEWLFGITMLGVAISSSLIYYFSDKLDFKVWLNKHQGLYNKIQKGLNSRFGALFITVWVMFPAVPTDAIGYVSGAMNINYWKYISALMIGQFFLCFVYIYGGLYIMESLLGM